MVRYQRHKCACVRPSEGGEVITEGKRITDNAWGLIEVEDGLV